MAMAYGGWASLLLGLAPLAINPAIVLAQGPPAPAPSPGPAGQGAGRRTEVSITLDFDAPLTRVMPLFGMFEEKRWDSSWMPRAVRPDEEGQQRPGVVFTTGEGAHAAVWVLTDYDIASGLIRYVVMRDSALTELRIQGNASGADRTRVTVTYRITALSDEGAAYVEHFESDFPHQGPHWQAAVSGALRNRP